MFVFLCKFTQAQQDQQQLGVIFSTVKNNNIHRNSCLRSWKKCPY